MTTCKSGSMVFLGGYFSIKGCRLSAEIFSDRLLRLCACAGLAGAVRQIGTMNHSLPRWLVLTLFAVSLSDLLSASPAAATIKRLDGQELTPTEIDATVLDLIAKGKVTGLALAVINDNQPVYVHAYGWRDKDKQLPFEPNTVTYGASLTKGVFASLVMQLVDEGRLDLDKSIADYLPKPLPEFEKYVDLRGDERWRKFTLRILLDHTSGMPNWRFVNADGKLDIKFEPGSRYSYCGEGINLAQFVVEQALHQEVGALLQERIFTPLGMPDTGLVWREAFAANLAVGHDEKGVNLGHKQRGSVRAAGSMDTTIVDFSKYLSALMQGRVLGPKALAEMTRPQIEIHSLFQFPVAAGPHAPPDTDENRVVGLAYGLGWGVLQHTPYGPAYFKEGHDDGWGNYAIVFPAKGTAIVLLSNSSNGEHIFRELLAKLIGDTFTPWKWERYVPYDQPGDAAQ